MNEIIDVLGCGETFRRILSPPPTLGTPHCLRRLAQNGEDGEIIQFQTPWQLISGEDEVGQTREGYFQSCVMVRKYSNNGNLFFGWFVLELICYGLLVGSFCLFVFVLIVRFICNVWLYACVRL